MLKDQGKDLQRQAVDAGARGVLIHSIRGDDVRVPGKDGREGTASNGLTIRQI